MNILKDTISPTVPPVGAQSPRYTRSALGMLPVDWQVTTLGALGAMFNGGTPSTSDERFWEGEIPWVSAKDMKVGRLRDTIDHVTPLALANGTRLVQAGTILMVVRGMALAKSFPVAIAECPVSFNQDLKAFVPRDSTSGEFIFRWLEANRSRILLLATEATHGTKRIPTNDLVSSLVPLPPRSEQRAIAEALSDVDGLLGALDALIAKKRAIKQAAMQELLTGRTRLPGYSGEWETRRLGEIASIRNEKVLPSQVDPSTLCVELEHIEPETGRLVEFSTASHSSSAKYRFSRGDVLFGRLRSYLRKYWLPDRNGICTTEIWPLRVDAAVADCGFLFGIVQSDSFVESASISYGTHMPRADWTVLRNFVVALPNVQEQIAIATVLSDMDTEIAALEQRRDKTRVIKQGMMQQLLTGRVRLVEPELAGAGA